jgi:hypothetical protein
LVGTAAGQWIALGDGSVDCEHGAFGCVGLDTGQVVELGNEVNDPLKL